VSTQWVGPDEAPYLVEDVNRVVEERNHAFAYICLILEDPYSPIPSGVLDAMRELIVKRTELY
jgi:hypothetical protein